ncbi:hypothetical protein FA13DRAFT_1790713 [Coprinellus micaceus]|uniref:Uncharacterized protein n=1 Tax=Coprinellus micaceus TaxID=71717 RepID=A0A4Y7TFW5_COPMI|nr:hypothetical protein FA13DRAFT_1790713 [Coprinellus micaceus]
MTKWNRQRQDPSSRSSRAKSSLRDADWMEVFRYMDTNQVASKAEVVRHFERQGIKFHRHTLGYKLKERTSIEGRVSNAVNTEAKAETLFEGDELEGSERSKETLRVSSRSSSTTLSKSTAVCRVSPFTVRWKPIYIAPDPPTSLVANTVQHPIALPASHDEQASPLLPGTDLAADGYAKFWQQFGPSKPIPEACGEIPSPKVSTSRIDDGREGNAGSPTTWFHYCCPGMSGRPLDHDANVQFQAVSPSTSTRALDEQEAHARSTSREAAIPSDRSSGQETSLGVDLELPSSESTPTLTPLLARKRRQLGRHDVPRHSSAEPPDSVPPRETVRSGLPLALPRSRDVFQSEPSSTITYESTASTTLRTSSIPFNSSEHTLQSDSFPENDEYLDPDAHDIIDEEARPEVASSSLERQLEILGLRSRLWELWCP